MKLAAFLAPFLLRRSSFRDGNWRNPVLEHPLTEIIKRVAVKEHMDSCLTGGLDTADT